MGLCFDACTSVVFSATVRVICDPFKNIILEKEPLGLTRMPRRFMVPKGSTFALNPPNRDHFPPFAGCVVCTLMGVLSARGVPPVQEGCSGQRLTLCALH